MTSLWRRLRRVEVRIGLALAASISLLVLALLGILFLVSTHEAAEVWDEMLRGELREARDDMFLHLDPSSRDRQLGGVAFRLVGADGEITSYGDWPSGRRYPVGTA